MTTISKKTLNKVPKIYKTPELKEWGSVAEITAAGKTNPGQDAFSGSVNARGLERRRQRRDRRRNRRG